MSHEPATHGSQQSSVLLIGKTALVGAAVGAALSGVSHLTGPAPGGIPLQYALFVGTLLGIALAHPRALQIAFAGLVSAMTYSVLAVEGFHLGEQLGHEAIGLVDLGGLLVGFGLLADHFERSGVPERIPRFLPRGAPGAFALLAAVFVMSAFLDNIAAALIGGGVASAVFRRRVHVSYLAAIVLASNAGGAGSVIGDTTTTMMWLHGVGPLEVLPAFSGSFVALVVSGVVAAWVQNRYAPIELETAEHEPIGKGRLVCVLFIIAAAVSANVLRKGALHEYEHTWPILALAIWGTLLASALAVRPTWSIVPTLLRTAGFLLSLVLMASFMPLESLPHPTTATTFVIGAVSAVFDNIPLTSLALNQGGYVWPMLAFAVGVGGSMMWFGSSAGVALCSRFTAARSTLNWLRHGWHVPLAYTLGFVVIALLNASTHVAQGH
ncbi:MAG: citrate transporter [Planctomycetota bacterium]